MLCGDFNARTGKEKDFIDTGGNNHLDVSPLYQPPVTKLRHSYDNIVNKSGKEILQMCKALGLYIVNGRTRGDSLGRFTYCSVLGNSVIDYAITDLYAENINVFTVLPQCPISDHNQIILYLKKTETDTQTHTPEDNPIPLPKHYKWTETSLTDYTNAFNNTNIQNMLDTFLCNQYLVNKDSINLATKDLNNIFMKLAKESKMKRPNPKSNKKQAKEQWFDSECSFFRKHLRNLSNRKHNDPENQELCHEYHTALKLHNTIIKQIKAKFTDDGLVKIKNRPKLL